MIPEFWGQLVTNTGGAKYRILAALGTGAAINASVRRRATSAQRDPRNLAHARIDRGNVGIRRYSAMQAC